MLRALALARSPALGAARLRAAVNTSARTAKTFRNVADPDKRLVVNAVPATWSPPAAEQQPSTISKDNNDSSVGAKNPIVQRFRQLQQQRLAELAAKAKPPERKRRSKRRLPVQASDVDAIASHQSASAQAALPADMMLQSLSFSVGEAPELQHSTHAEELLLSPLFTPDIVGSSSSSSSFTGPLTEEGAMENDGNSVDEHGELQPQRQRTRKQHEVMRLAKRIARSGKSSRREAERLIQEGRVKINGTVALSPAVNVSTADRVRVDGKELSTHIAPARVWAVHKARGELVARSDEKGRRCVLERVKAVGLSDALKPVGRLDFMTEGLLLLTDDGDLARKLEHPTVGLRREYRVRVFGSVTAEKLRTMQRGCVIDGMHYKGMVVNIDRGEKHNTWLVVHCVEGKNNQIRRVCQHLNLTVNRLIRTAFGPFKLGKMASGGVAEVPLHEHFLQQVNTAMETGVPVPAPRAADPRSVRAAALTGRRRAGLARAKAVPPRPSVNKKGPAAAAEAGAAQRGVRVKRGRGGGVTVRAPKADAAEPVREARKRKKANKVLAWKLRAKARDARQQRRAPAAGAAAPRPGVRRAAAAPARAGSRRAASAAGGGGVRRAAGAGAGIKRGGARSKAQSGAGRRQ